MAYRLQTLLDLRRRGEDEAGRALTMAAAVLEGANRAQKRLDAAVIVARDKLVRERASPRSASRAEDGAAVARFVARLAAAVEAARVVAAAHRDGALAAAAAAEESARLVHQTARRDLEALEKHRDKASAAERAEAERRSEAAADDRPRRAR